MTYIECYYIALSGDSRIKLSRGGGQKCSINKNNKINKNTPFYTKNVSIIPAFSQWTNFLSIFHNLWEEWEQGLS